MDPTVPLVIPEINPQALRSHHGGIIANPNCSTAVMLDGALAAAQAFRAEALFRGATYQSVSGPGAMRQ
jgi:aspartate-semialdehyde dehydrogenase